MKLVKNNQKGRSLLTNSFLFKMVQMRRCFLTTCTKPVHEEKNIQKMCRFKQESGRSMVEMLGVLAIIGVLSIGGIAGYSKAMEKHKLNKTIDEINTIVQNLKTLCSGKTDICNSFSDRDTLKKLQIIPDYMWHNNDLVNIFNGPVSVMYDQSDVIFNMPKAQTVTISYDGIPQEICIGLVYAFNEDISVRFMDINGFIADRGNLELRDHPYIKFDALSHNFTDNEMSVMQMPSARLPLTLNMIHTICTARLPARIMISFAI